jgi:Tfp pilus assembly ATPase PilU
MEHSTQEGGQTFDQALYALYAEGRISQEQALANADSSNNLRIRIHNLNLSRQPKEKPHAGPQPDDFRIEGVTPAPHLRRL